ncbi:MAG: hypothetical protein EOO46_01450 [Flavobacterium sp.]|nr:MAG: hypothetical protein EOO46_01450 [Flavobacterium sp.]
MKTVLKIITTTLFTVTLFSCSSDESAKTLEIVNIDATNYVIAGKVLNNHVAVVTFSSNDKVIIKSIEEEVEADYTVHGDTIKIENYGYVKIQNNAIVAFENGEINFDQVHLLQKTSDNAFKGKYFTGPVKLLSGSGVEQIFHVRFSAPGALYGYGESFDMAFPDNEFELIANVAGKYQQEGYSTVFYILNDKLICEIRTNQFGSPIYFYSDELMEQEQ